MELRHLDTLLAIDDEGSFTAAADALATVQSNVSEQVRQLEAELGVQLLTRGRRGAVPTECGERVLERARRVRRELEAMRADLSMLQGLEAGDASFGTVGTASRWVVPRLVAAPVPDGPVLLDALATFGLVLPPVENPLRAEIEHAASERGLALPLTVEV